MCATAFSPAIDASRLARPIYLAEAARRDIERLHDWLFEKNRHAALRLIEVLQDHLESLADFSDRGRSIGEGIRELVAPFGGSNYVIRYEVDPDSVFIARIWHGLERR